MQKDVEREREKKEKKKKRKGKESRKTYSQKQRPGRVCRHYWQSPALSGAGWRSEKYTGRSPCRTGGGRASHGAARSSSGHRYILKKKNDGDSGQNEWTRPVKLKKKKGRLWNLQREQKLFTRSRGHDG
jgi:hypothetical protein